MKLIKYDALFILDISKDELERLLYLELPKNERRRAFLLSL